MQDFCYYFTNPEKNYLILPKKMILCIFLKGIHTMSKILGVHSYYYTIYYWYCIKLIVCIGR